MLFHQVWWNCFYFELKTVKKFLKVMAMEAWVSVFSAFPVLQEASFPTFLLKTFHFQKLVLESESRYIVGCFICSTFNCITVFLSHLKYTDSPPLTLFFETLTKPCKQLKEWFSTKTPKWDSQHFQNPLIFRKYPPVIHW